MFLGQRSAGDSLTSHQRIIEWYGNARRFVPSQQSPYAPRPVGKSVEKLLTDTGRRKRLEHVFSALFYDTHVKPRVDYPKYLASLAPGTEPMSNFAYRNSCTRDAWENAPPDIRQKVEAYKNLSEMSLEEL